MKVVNFGNKYLSQIVIGCVLLAAIPTTTFAEGEDGFWLATPAEYTKSLHGGAGINDEFFEKAFGAPEIKLVSPQLGNTGVSSPMKIELRFEPMADSRVLPESFRILYGMFKLDITDRILEHAKVTDAGIVASNAKLPAGEHNIALEISDDLGRTGRTKLTLLVVE